MNVKRLVVITSIAWVILTGTAFYCLHFGVHVRKEVTSLVDARRLPMKEDGVKYYSQEHKDHYEVDTTGTLLESSKMVSVHSESGAVSRKSGLEAHVRGTVSNITNALDRGTGVQYRQLPAALPSPAPIPHSRNSNPRVQHQLPAALPPPAPVPHSRNSNPYVQHHRLPAALLSPAPVPHSRNSNPRVQHHRLPAALPPPAPVPHSRNSNPRVQRHRLPAALPPPAPVPHSRNSNPRVQHHRLPAALPSLAPVPHNSNSNVDPVSYPGLISRSNLRMWEQHGSPSFAVGKARSSLNHLNYLKNVARFTNTKNKTFIFSPQSRRALKYKSWYLEDLRVARHLCTNRTCLLLSGTFPSGSVDTDYYDQIRCFGRAIHLLQKSLGLGNDPMNCTCVLKSTERRNEMVGLVSLPGSGNTWIRGLLEQVTNICTGSMWCDANLRATQFCAEGMRGTRVLVVKNHDSEVRWRGQLLPLGTDNIAKPQFDRVVFIHRNPFKSIVAEHNRAIARSIWESQFNSKNYTIISPNDHILYYGEEYFGK